jgi:signal transduction histidine kinase
MGLVDALKTHVERINLTSNFSVELHHNFEAEIRLPSNVEIVSYRVLLELINNSITHSKGDMIHINLIVNENQFIIIYSDNGIGFDLDKILHDNTKGIGLRNILSRIKSIKGMVDFESDTRGFSLAIDINL